MLQDFRYAIRTLKRQPGYAVAAVLALALGVGANTSIYSIAEGILFRPLPMPDIDRVLVIDGGRPDRFDEQVVSAADVMDIRERATSFQEVAATVWWSPNVTGEGFPERIQGFRVTQGFFELTGAKAILGRLLSPADYTAAEDNHVVVLSERLWERKFARDQSVLGRIIRLNGEPHTIVGVAPRWTRIPAESEMWAPVIADEKFRADPVNRYTVYARLKPEASRNQAAAEMRTLAQRIAVERPATNAGRDLRVSLLRERISGNLTAEYMRMTLVAVALLLLIAASNVANLLFAIVSSRGREIALRQALGSSRWRIVRQFLAESLVLGAACVPVAMVIAMWSLDLNRRAMPAEVEIHLPGWSTIGVDGYALAFGIGTALLTSIIAGLLPAWIGSRADLNAQLREGGRSVVGVGSKSRTRAALVVVQVTLSMVLMAGSALMYRGAAKLAAAAPGRHPELVLTASVALPLGKYPTAVNRGEFAHKLLEEGRAMPGVESAALIRSIPYEGGWNMSHVETDATPASLKESRKQLPEVQYQLASAGYFPMMGIPLTKGRDLADTDAADTQPVVVISELAARQFFGSDDPIGNRLKLDDEPWVTVVGVCGDVLHVWILRHPLPTVYRPYRQAGGQGISILLRTKGRSPEALAPELRAVVMQLDPDLPLAHVDRQSRVIALRMVGLNYITGMLGASGLMSLLLAVVGVYSLMSFTATERTREVGIRMALGARPGEVIGMLVGHGLRLVGIGLAVGLVGAGALSKLFASVIYGVQAFDPLSLGLGAAVLSFGALLACYIPARWASRVDPMEALRHD